MQEILGGLFVLGGAGLMLIAAIGAVRMPDLFTRMQATTKAASLGAGMVLIGVAIHFGQPGVTMRAAVTIAFIVLTTPVAAHLLGRAAYFLGVPLWSGSVRDELRGHYDPATHALDWHPPAPGAAPRPPRPPRRKAR
jgi:multicomponent Na+:H+ antiporter subunit G